MIKIPISLSIVIPAFNEGELLKKIVRITLKEAEEILGKSFEIIIVDDGSTDLTRLIAKQVARTYKNINLIRHDERQGFGATMISAIQKAKYEYITFIPSDGQVYLRDLTEALKKAKNFDLIVTYRTNKKDYTLFRHFLSLGFKVLMRFFFGLSLKDYNWAQVYKRKIFFQFIPESQGVFFLGETIVRAQKMNFKIGESRILYRPRISGESKNANFRVALEAFIDLFKIWLKINSFHEK